MMIIGCDYHPRYQQIAMMDTATGELVERRLEHENGEARAFYASLLKPVLVAHPSRFFEGWWESLVLDTFVDARHFTGSMQTKTLASASRLRMGHCRVQFLAKHSNGPVRNRLRDFAQLTADELRPYFVATAMGWVV